jgi:uncharacterized protein DUF4124
MASARIIALLGLLALAPAPFAAMLYKSIGPNGVVAFSDTPPETGVILEERPVPSDSTSPAGVDADEQPLAHLAELTPDDDADAALARANQKVDLAEHALALARRSLWSTLDGLRLGASQPPTRADEERARYYMHNVIAARQNLLATLRKREQH